MSHQATTLLFSVGLLRKQQAGVRLFRDYEEITRRLAQAIITKATSSE